MVAKPRANRRQIAELSFILRAILDRMAVSGGPKGKAHRAALDLVDAFVRGQVPTPDALKAAHEGVAKAVERLGVSSPPLWKALYWLPISALLHMIERGEDMSEHVLEHAKYAVDSAAWGADAQSFDALCAQARAHAATIEDAPLPVPTREVDERVRAAESALLARSRAALSGEARALFDFAQPERDAAQTTDRATLAKRLGELDLPASEAVLAFEETFGGLLLPITTLDDWREDRLCTLVGPWAMLATHPTIPRSGKTAESTRLVPVARGTQEDIYFLDERGAPTTTRPSASPARCPSAQTVRSS